MGAEELLIPRFLIEDRDVDLELSVVIKNDPHFCEPRHQYSFDHEIVCEMRIFFFKALAIFLKFGIILAIFRDSILRIDE